jgi:hypothetical protein
MRSAGVIIANDGGVHLAGEIGRWSLGYRS